MLLVRRMLFFVLSCFVVFLPYKAQRKQYRHFLRTLICAPSPKRLKDSVKIVSSRESLELIINHRRSIARYGDGEIAYLFTNKDFHFFQPYNKKLQKRLVEILKNPIDSCIIGLPDWLDGRDYNSNFYKNCILVYWWNFQKYIKKKNIYASSFCFASHSFAEGNYALIKQVWQNRKVILITGKSSAFIWDEDLFDNFNLIDTIYTKAVDAFSEYDTIISSVVNHKQIDKDTLIMLSLGLTATILAYDLSKMGYQALDVGHISNYYKTYKGEMPHIEELRKNKLFTDGETNINSLEIIGDKSV